MSIARTLPSGPATQRRPFLEVSVSIVLLVAIAAVFWGLQRYPALIPLPEAGESMADRTLRLGKTFFMNLLRLTLLTLPWMLLAALLGALAAEAIPAYGTHLAVFRAGNHSARDPGVPFCRCRWHWT